MQVEPEPIVAVITDAEATPEQVFQQMVDIIIESGAPVMIPGVIIPGPDYDYGPT